MAKKSLFEIVNSLTLTLIGVGISIFGMQKISNSKVILCYHSVGDTTWRFSTPILDFRKQVEFIVKNFKVKSLRELLENGANGIALTFDDGYLDVYDNALPLMEKYNIKGTMFVLGDIENVNRQELDNKLKLMNIKQIKHLHDLGWEIGSHTLTHSNLHKLSRKELIREIVESKNNLEKKLGIKIRYFAYPKGKYNKEIVEISRMAGYEAAFTVDGGFLSLKNKMLVTRLPMEGVVDLNQFSAMLSPFGLAVEALFMKVLQAKEKIQSKFI